MLQQQEIFYNHISYAFSPPEYASQTGGSSFSPLPWIDQEKFLMLQLAAISGPLALRPCLSTGLLIKMYVRSGVCIKTEVR